MGSGDRRDYDRGLRAALVHFSQGHCYWPGCTEPVLGAVDGKYKIRLEIAHIRAAKKGGERYVEDMTDEQRDAFENLIFLCGLHHKTVDERGAGERYPISTLERWKNERESGVVDKLRGLRDVTEEMLVELIAEAVRQREQDINATLARLERTDSEAAELMRELRDELQTARKNGSIIDPDSAQMLNTAAHILVGIEEWASMLYSAAEKLSGLEENASSLDSAAHSLIGLEDKAHLMMRAAASVNQAAARMEDSRGRY